MSPVTSYIFVIAAILLILQSTFATPILMKRNLYRNMQVHTLIQDVLSDLKERKHNGHNDSLLTRLRRNTAQWYVGSHHFNDYTHDRSSRRWTHRRHNTHNHQGGGQLVDA